MKSSSPLLVSKTQGWVVAVLLALLAAAVVFVSYSVIKQSYDDNQTKRDIPEINHLLDQMDKRNLELERKLVELESQVENLKD